HERTDDRRAGAGEQLGGRVRERSVGAPPAELGQEGNEEDRVGVHHPGRDGERQERGGDDPPAGGGALYPRKSRQSDSHIIAERRRLSVSTRSLWPWNMIGYSVYGM